MSEQNRPCEGVNLSLRLSDDGSMDAFIGLTEDEDGNVIKQEMEAPDGMSDSYPLFGICNYISICNRRDKDIVAGRICIIDEEYFKWLDENGFEDDALSFSQYLDDMSDDAAFRLLLKHGLDVTYSPLAVGVSIICGRTIPAGETHFRLDDRMKAELLKYLENIYGAGAVYVPGYVFSSETAANKETVKRLVSMARMYFEGDNPFPFPEWFTQDEWDKYTGPDGMFYFLRCNIPFVVECPVRSACVRVDGPPTRETLPMMPSVTDFSDGNPDEAPGIGGEPIEESAVGEMLEEYFGPYGEVDIQPFPHFLICSGKEEVQYIREFIDNEEILFYTERFEEMSGSKKRYVNKMFAFLTGLKTDLRVLFEFYEGGGRINGKGYNFEYLEDDDYEDLRAYLTRLLLRGEKLVLKYRTEGTGHPVVCGITAHGGKFFPMSGSECRNFVNASVEEKEAFEDFSDIYDPEIEYRRPDVIF